MLQWLSNPDNITEEESEEFKRLVESETKQTDVIDGVEGLSSLDSPTVDARCVGGHFKTS